MKKSFPLIFIGVLVFLNVLILTSGGNGSGNGLLTVAFLDVGQGDAIFIESPTGLQVLVDGGANNSVLRGLGKVMSFDDRTIDVLIATHPDKDHVGGFPSVLENYEVDTYIDSGVVSETGIYKELKKKVKDEGSVELLARRGMVLDLGGGAILTILFPNRDVANEESNKASVITKIEYGQSSFLLTGDSPKSIESYLTSLDGEYLDVDVLKVGHHGSKTSSAKEFVSVVSPEYAVISAGKDNRYGHPHKSVLDILDAQGANVLITYEKGMIVFLSDGERLWVR